MQVWCGTSRYLSLRSILLTLLTIGTMKTTPGPFAPTSRPRVKTTTLSYSRTILIEEPMRARTIIRRIAIAT